MTQLKAGAASRSCSPACRPNATSDSAYSDRFDVIYPRPRQEARPRSTPSSSTASRATASSTCRTGCTDRQGDRARRRAHPAGGRDLPRRPEALTSRGGRPKPLLIAPPKGVAGGGLGPLMILSGSASSTGGMPMPRLFTGLEIPPAIGQELSSYRFGAARRALDRPRELSPHLALHRRRRPCDARGTSSLLGEMCRRRSSSK